MKNNLIFLIKDLNSLGNPNKARDFSWFFKTGKGEYGEGDLFLGISVPECRQLAKKYADLSLSQISKLIKSKYHEHRLTALLILVQKYRSCVRQDLTQKQKEIVDFYLKNTKYINNWDLVDLSVHYILGDYLLNNNRKILEKLAKSKNLWERRMAIVATFAFIYKGESKWTFKIVEILVKDKQDLIHKACGWMLREVGKKCGEDELTPFLDAYISQMPRTMLRYSIEKFEEKKRLFYLHKK